MRLLGLVAFCVALGIAGTASGQIVEDFEGWPLGIFPNNGMTDPWETWEQTGDAGDLEAGTGFGGSQGLLLSGLDDVVYLPQPTPYVGGQWIARGKMLIPSGFTGEAYFILLNTFTYPPLTADWSTQVHINPTTDPAVHSFISDAFVGGGDVGGSYEGDVAADVWHEILVAIDLDTNTDTGNQAIYFIDGNLPPVNAFVASGGWRLDAFTGNLEIQAADLFSNGSSDYYMDDFSLQTADSLPVWNPVATLNPGEVVISWQNPFEGTGGYDVDIEIFRNGDPLGTAAPDAIGFTDSAPLPGLTTYEIIGTRNGLSLSNRIQIDVFVIDPAADILLWRPTEELNSVVDSGQIIADELAAQGHTVQITTELPDAGLMDQFTAVYSCMGMYPANHAISDVEAQTLRNYADAATADTPKNLYIEGGDIWGFNPQQVPLDEIDGVNSVDTADGESACDVIETTGQDSGVANGLDLTGSIFAHGFTDCSWVDELAVDTITLPPGAAGAAAYASNDLMNTIVYHDLLVSGLGEGKVVCNSMHAGSLGAADLTTLLTAIDNVFAGLVVDPDEIFRADCNGDGGFNGLIDGLYALNYQFVPGSPTPPCIDQCDFDDDNGFNGLLDGLGMLNFQFVPGSPAPAPPGLMCGEDPTGLFDCVTLNCP